MRIEGIDVGQEGGHDSRHTRTQVLGGQAVEVSVVHERVNDKENNVYKTE